MHVCTHARTRARTVLEVISLNITIFYFVLVSFVDQAISACHNGRPYIVMAC